MMKPCHSIKRLLVRRQRLGNREEAVDVAGEEIAAVAFEPPGCFPQLLELGAARLASNLRWPPVLPGLVGLRPFTASRLRPHARHRAVAFARNHDESVAGAKSDLECIAAPVRRRLDLLKPVASEECERLAHGRGKLFERKRCASHGPGLD